jgi:hypothetical protein
MTTTGRPGYSPGRTNGTLMARAPRTKITNEEFCLVRCSRLGLAWGNGVWLEGCPQVKRCVPTFVLAG